MREKVKAVLPGKAYKNEILGKLEWITKERSTGKKVSSCDISVALVRKTGGKGANYTHVNFTFRNGIENIICSDKDNEYIQFCVHKNRIFFRQAESTVGYKLYYASAACAKNKYTKIPIFEGADGFIGDYDLKYDDFLELYYIDKETKYGD